jgi:hypothetical protein
VAPHDQADIGNSRENNMPSSFQYYPIENFPVENSTRKEYTTNMQMLLPDENIADEARSTIKYLGVSPYHEYNKYYVRHETLRDTWVRIDHEDRKRVIFVEQFDIYIPPNYTYALVRTKLKIANELFQRISEKSPEFSYKLRQIDLGALKDDLHPQVRGGWFKDLYGLEEVQTAAIFGTNVSESDEWDKYATFGTLSSLVIEFKHHNEMHSVNISATGAITLFSNYDEPYALELVEKFNNILMKFQKEIDPKRPRGSKKKA